MKVDITALPPQAEQFIKFLNHIGCLNEFIENSHLCYDCRDLNTILNNYPPNSYIECAFILLIFIVSRIL